jgi:hypothetical protein
MLQAARDAPDQGWSIRSVFVADQDGPRRIEQTIRLLLSLSAATSGAEAKPGEGGDDESGNLRPRVYRSPGTRPDD